jgi:hypothetical protein
MASPGSSGFADRLAVENVRKALSGREAVDPFQEEIGIRRGDPAAGALVDWTEPLFKQPEQSLGLSLLPASLQTLFPQLLVP